MNITRVEEQCRSIVSVNGVLIDKEDLEAFREIDLFGYGSISSCIKKFDKGRRISELDLEYCGLKSLPPSIERLQNLKVLKLDKSDLEKLPEEIGNLSSLEWLDLTCSKITSLPSSFCNLTNLKALNLYGTQIKSLPESMEPLINLMYLDLRATPINLAVCTLRLAKQCRSLGRIVCQGTGWGTKVCYHLACNRARHRIGFWTIDRRILQYMPLAWPIVINRSDEFFENYPMNCNVPNRNYRMYHYSDSISAADGIYQLLVDERESFIGILLGYYTINRKCGTKRKIWSAPTQD